MSRTPPDLQAVLDTVVQLAGDLCDAKRNGSLFLIDGDTFHLVAGSHQASDQIRDWQEPARQPWPIERAYIVKHVFESKDVFQARDASAEADSDYFRQDAVEFGYRTVLGVPLLRGHTVIGVLSLIRPDVRPFSDHEIGLVRAFASQAAIAIDNARLSTETHEALERQIAITQILEATSQTTKDLTVVFRTIAETAVQLCHADNASIFRADGEVYRHVASATSSGRFADAAAFELLAAEAARKSRLVKERTTVVGRGLLEKATVQIVDVLADPEYDTNRSSEFMAALSGQNERTILGVPIVKGAALLGIIIARRNEVRPFSEREINVLETFARQAAIAVENTRLFNETKEALGRQTALAEVLRSISSSPTDAHPVLEAVALNAARFCGSDDALVVLTDERTVRVVAHYGPVGTALGPSDSTWPLDRTSVSGRSITERRTVHVNDLQSESAEYPVGSDQARRGQYRTTLATPLLREGMGLGAIVLRRIEARPFTDKQIELLQTFADQAAIAIENARLFNETRTSLERQTATADVLRLISRSAFELGTVLDSVLETAARLCGAQSGVVFRLESDGGYHPVAALGLDQAEKDLQFSFTMESPNRGNVIGRAVLDRHPAQIEDALTEPEVNPAFVELPGKLGCRGLVGVPILREGEPIGVMSLRRNEVRPFTPQEIELVTSFADQAAIAIENVRLFNETKEALERQTAISEILRVISSSPMDVQPVLDTIAQSAARFCNANDAAVAILRDDGSTLLTDTQGGIAQAPHMFQLSHRSVTPRAIKEARLFNVADMEALPDDEFGEGKEYARQHGYRGFLAAPLLKEGRAIGAIQLRRALPGAFGPQEVERVQTFAAQAVIALDNVRLFNETKEALERQTATAEVLKVISESPTDLQPVFDSIGEHARGLCEAELVHLLVLKGDRLELVGRGRDPEARADFMRVWSLPLDRSNMAGRAILSRSTIHVADVLADPEYDETIQQGARPWNTVLAVPLMRGTEAIGAIALLRGTIRPFERRQIELVETFADQAAIAIENVRLFNETREGLEQQTAVSEVLKTISRSAFDLKPVLDIVLENAIRLAGADIGWLSRVEGERFQTIAYSRSFPADVREALARDRAAGHLGGEWRPFGSESGVMGTVLERRTTVQIAVAKAGQVLVKYLVVRLTESRGVLGVPMLREGRVIGGVVLARYDVRPFNERAVELVQTFADQAAIAIENVRLFDETRAALERETAVGNVLKTLSRTVFDLEPALAAVVESAARLADADVAWMTKQVDASTYDWGARYA